MNSYRKYGIALLAGVLLVAGWAGNALALTNACTEIFNQAFLDYSVGGVSQPQIGSTDDPSEGDADDTTDFQVATRVDLTVATFNSPKTATGVDNVLTFSITNTGNDTQRYMLQLYAATNGYDRDGNAGTTNDIDNFDMSDTNIRVYTDTNNTFDPLLGDGESLVSATAADDGTDLGLTGNVTGNNGVLYVHVVADVPSGRANGDKAYYALKARTYQTAGNPGAGGVNGAESDGSSDSKNSCGEAVVLYDGDVDAGGSGPGGVTDGANDGDSYAIGVYVVDTATLSMTKRHCVVYDPVNGEDLTCTPGVGNDPVAIPGARIQYTMTITNNSASVDATGLSLTDQIPANTDFYGGSISMPAGAVASYSTAAVPGPGDWGAAAPGAGVIAPAITFIKVDNFDLAASGTAEVKFWVVIE